MTKHQSLIKLAALAIAVSAALPAVADTTVTTVEHSGTHHYVYYRDHDIYYSPDTHMYFWLDQGRWQSGASLPPESQRYVTTKGVDIDLDTDRPYERNDYVVSRYRDVPETRTTTERTVADNGQQTTTTTTTTTKHRYVYYGDHDIYFSPESKKYYWMSDGGWHSGDALPMNMAPYVRTQGINIELDTERPYERNDYVIEHYRQRPRDDQ
jgi:hypothetical protein